MHCILCKFQNIVSNHKVFFLFVFLQFLLTFSPPLYVYLNMGNMGLGDRRSKYGVKKLHCHLGFCLLFLIWKRIFFLKWQVSHLLFSFLKKIELKIIYTAIKTMFSNSNKWKDHNKVRTNINVFFKLKLFKRNLI